MQTLIMLLQDQDFIEKALKVKINAAMSQGVMQTKDWRLEPLIMFVMKHLNNDNDRFRLSLFIPLHLTHSLAFDRLPSVAATPVNNFVAKRTKKPMFVLVEHEEFCACQSHHNTHTLTIDRTVDEDVSSNQAQQQRLQRFKV